MTSKLTRERLEQLADNKTICKVSWDERIELAQIALAAMDSEPVIIVGDDGGDALAYRRLIQSFAPGTKLYLHAPQPVAVTDDELNAALQLHRLKVDGHSQLSDAFRAGFRYARRTAPQPAPVIPDGYVMVPKEPTDEMIHAGHLYFQRSMEMCDDFTPSGMFNSMLAAAPQSPGSEPATVPGKWIPVSEQKPDCWCLTCRPVVLNDMRFVVCPDCGNKRCPRANDHRNACTGSNEPGQEGSAYPDTPQEVPDEK
ncbi:hypothetical protein [Klebsiella pneumoniae complex sp. WS1876_1]|uniref:hypothetical protein n=1 Tax=Klebsiella pneumoniae complex sp. WS1876_1 TaxID=3390279 RepID=UPI003C082525